VLVAGCAARDAAVATDPNGGAAQATDGPDVVLQIVEKESPLQRAQAEFFTDEVEVSGLVARPHHSVRDEARHAKGAEKSVRGAFGRAGRGNCNQDAGAVQRLKRRSDVWEEVECAIVRLPAD